MNLHEECLLKYLQNPDELTCMTELLKFNNYIFEKQFVLENFLAKSNDFAYNERVS